MAAERLLHLVYMIGDTSERCRRVGKRQQIVEIGRAVGRPGQMFGNQRRLIAVDEGLEPLEMRFVERLRAADRHAHAVERNRVVLADLVKRSMGRTAGAHVVFGVDFKEAISLPFGQDRLQMFVLEASANTARNGMCRKAEC